MTYRQDEVEWHPTQEERVVSMGGVVMFETHLDVSSHNRHYS
jgi:hypothetical protein